MSPGFAPQSYDRYALFEMSSCRQQHEAGTTHPK